MENTKVYVVNSKLDNYYFSTHGMLHYMALRGYRPDDEYGYIRIKKAKFNSCLRKIRTMLNETGALKKRKEEEKTIHYIKYEPMKYQNNPLAETFRYTKPDTKELFFYMLLLSELAFDYEHGRNEVTTLAPLIDTEYLSESNNVDKDTEQKVRRFLNMLEKQGVVERNKEKKNVRYKLNYNIWAGFGEEELVQLYDYLSFLRNVMPFELPYMLLQENLKLQLKLRCEKYIENDFFLFTDRNPVKVLDSEAIYQFLSMAKSGETMPIQFQDTLKELVMPGKWERDKLWKSKNEKKTEWGAKELDEKLPPLGIWHYNDDINGSNNELHVKCLTYDTFSGELTTDKGAALSDVAFYKAKVKDGKVIYEDEMMENEKVLKRDEEVAFDNIYNIYFERLIELSYMREKNGWTREELEQHFFRGTEIYEDVWSALVPEEGAKDYEYSCFVYDGQKYRLKKGLRPMFFTPKLITEAFKNLLDLEYTKAFLDECVIELIRDYTKDIECSWSEKSIHALSNTKNDLSEKSYTNIREVLQRFRDKGYVYDKNGNMYYMLRIEYSAYKDRFRLFVENAVSGEIKLLPLEVFDFHMDELLTAALDVNDRQMREKIEEKREAWCAKVDGLLKEMQLHIRANTPAISGALDNLRSRKLMNYLSRFDRVIRYVNDNPDEKPGEFFVTMRFWPDDEAEIMSELEVFKKEFEIERG